MPLDYSKFDHIADSDDEVPDPKAAAEAEQRRELAEQLKARMASATSGTAVAASEQEAAPAAAARPAHQADRFAHSESDESSTAKDSLKAALGATRSLKVHGGVLSVVAVAGVEGEALRAQVRGEDRHIFDLSFELAVAFKWMGSNFDAGMQRAEGRLKFSDFTSETTLDSAGNPPARAFAWLDAELLEPRRRADLEAAVGAAAWPPAPGTLAAEVLEVLRRWAAKLPEVARLCREQARQQREAGAEEAAG